MKNKEGWDGKMRVEPKAVITNPEALEDSDYSDPEAPPVDEIQADEGIVPRRIARSARNHDRWRTDGLTVFQISWPTKTRTQR